MHFNTIFFIGPQGSGKGTQARILAQALGFFYWEMGGILRAMRSEDSDLARQVVSLIDQGVLLTDGILLQVVKAKLSDIPREKGVIFDGIPRRLGQAQFLLDVLRNDGRENFATLFVNVPKDETFKRLLQRAKTEGRADDTESRIEFRLKQYEQDTLPVLDFLKTHTTFFEVDGTPAVEEVTRSINEKLGL